MATLAEGITLPVGSCQDLTIFPLKSYSTTRPYLGMKLVSSVTYFKSKNRPIKLRTNGILAVMSKRDVFGVRLTRENVTNKFCVSVSLRLSPKPGKFAKTSRWPFFSPVK